MPNKVPADEEIDWSLTTWEGARLEQMRRWAALPLVDMIKAIEEMGELAGQLQSGTGTELREEPAGYQAILETTRPK